MKKFTRVCGIAAPMYIANIDTGKLGHGEWNRDHPEQPGGGLFLDWRLDANGQQDPEFILNRPRYKDCKVLVSGPNFGCGSSRETAVWALLDVGISCVIAPSFGDIFRDNSYQNGLLPIVLPDEEVLALVAYLEAAGVPKLCVDLETCRIEVPGRLPLAFSIAGDRRLALLEGLDETTLIHRSEPDIAAFEAADRLQRPWIYGRRTIPMDSGKTAP